MFAIIKTGGKQYLVKDGDVITVERNPKVDVLLGESSVKLETVEEVKGPKVKILKHRAKKHSRTRMGHRQKLVKVKVSLGTKKETTKNSDKK